MTAVGAVDWGLNDPCFYRASMYPGPPSPCTVTAIDGDVLTVTATGAHGESFFVYRDEITWREL